MSWVPLAIGGWLLVSVVVALVIGLAIRLADRMSRGPVVGARDVVVRPRSQPTPAADPPAVRPRRQPAPFAGGTRSGRLRPVRTILPTSEPRPTAPTADSR